MHTLSASLDIDIALVIFFLLLTLVVGIYYGRQVKDLREYALGDKNFPTSVLTMTIIATSASGSAFFIVIENTYSQGLYHLIAILGLPLGIWIFGQLAVRMGPFMHNLSVAEAMGDMYGKTVQIISGITALIARTGYVAIQLKVMGTMLASLLHQDSGMLTIVAASIVLVYTTFGGVRSVTFTDVLQLFTFGLLIPLVALAIWQDMQGPQVAVTLATNPLFDLTTVVGRTPRFMATLGLFLYCATPGYFPEIFQRVAMAKDPQQAKRAFTSAAVIFLLILLLQAWIGLLLLAAHPSIASNQVVPYLIQHYTYTGLRGLLGVGILALAMSTADSVLNACAVVFANDVVKPLAGQDEGKVITARIFALFLGLTALVLALYGTNILNMLLFAASFYMPLVSVPLLLAVLGFRSTTRAVLLGMAAGGMTMLLWSIFGDNSNSIVPGMLANLVGLLGSHYLLREPGGWVPLAPTHPVVLARVARRKAWQRRIEAVKKFKLYAYLQKNLPQEDSYYVFFACYIIATNYIAYYTIPQTAHHDIYHGLNYVVLLGAIAFVTFPIWSLKFSNYRFITFFWPLGIGTILFFVGPLLLILSNFHTMQMMVLMTNFVVAVLLFQGSLALILAVVGISLAVWFFQQYTGEAIPWSDISSSQLPYGLLLFTSFLLVLFLGKQAYTKLDREKEILTRLDEENKANLLAAEAKNRQAVQALQNTRGEHLLDLVKELKTIKLKEADAAHIQAIQTKMIPLAFQLQVLATKAQDYLRLHVATFPIEQWLQSVQEKLREKGIEKGIYYQVDTQHQELKGDAECLTQLLVKSIAVLHASNKAQQEKEQRVILVRLEDTQLHYPLPDVAPGYVKQVLALRVLITTATRFPPLTPGYAADLSTSQTTTPATTQALDQFANDRIIKAHYGYAKVDSNTLCYVLPIDLREVRPKDMDKSYMELGAKVVRANDQYLDAQEKEKEFLAAVAQYRHVDIGLVKTALELIKWYHGPVVRHSGEPFYLHPLTVAQIVLDYNTDEATVIGALLHDTVEDTSLLLQHLEKVFGPKTAEVVNVVTHLQSSPGSLYKVKLSAEENIRMLERTGNQQALYVKLADRMHNMRTIEGHKSLEKQKSIAHETLTFFVPLAGQLGLPHAGEELAARCSKVLRKSPQVGK